MKKILMVLIAFVLVGCSSKIESDKEKLNGIWRQTKNPEVYEEHFCPFYVINNDSVKGFETVEDAIKDNNVVENYKKEILNAGEMVWTDEKSSNKRVVRYIINDNLDQVDLDDGIFDRWFARVEHN